MNTQNINRLSPGVYLLALGYGLGTTVAVISVAMSGLIGADLAPYPSLTTLPYGLQFIGGMLSAITSSLLQAVFGRKLIVFIAGLLGVFAGWLGVLALTQQDFYLLCLTHFLMGLFLANIALLRFAALDLSPKSAHAKTLSMVMFGGTFAALLGPFISRNADHILPAFNHYQAAYIAISIIAASIVVMVLFLHFPSTTTQKTLPAVKISHLLKNRLFIFAIVCGGVGYMLMNILMINSSIQMKANGFGFKSVTYYIQIHVLAMFFPSLFNMKVLDKIGLSRFLATGMVLQILVSAMFIFGQNRVTFLLALLLLGLSWNMLYTAASYIVGELFSEPHKKFKAQGVNDLLVGVMSATGALFAGVLLNLLGWNNLQWLNVAITLLLVGLFCWIYPTLKHYFK